MVKHSLRMGRFFTAERFGKPQFVAGALLLIFLLQCLWLASRAASRHEIDSFEIYRVERGLRHWQKRDFAGSPFASPGADRFGEIAGSPPPYLSHDGYDPHHSALWYLIAAAPFLVSPDPLSEKALSWLSYLACAPYLVFALLLGASLWYVARRLYGNAGGYIALALYCFAPGILRGAVLWDAQPDIGAAWGAFGAIFTAIAVSHTLYAPREVVLWNWRRILLLALSLALAIGSLFSLIVIVPLVLIFMLYLAPTRRKAAIVIWAAACAGGTALLFAANFFQPAAFVEGFRHAIFLEISKAAFASRAYWAEIKHLSEMSPALVLALPAALITYASWPRARYFGNTAPLITGLLLLWLGIANPHHPGSAFLLTATPFLFLFVAGIFADLVELSQPALAIAGIGGLLAASALWNLLALLRIPRG
jgi:hypothetical protein